MRTVFLSAVLPALHQIAAEADLSATDFRRFIESDKGLEEVLKAEAEGKQRGLNGVPFFFINGVPAFSGAQHPETFVAVFRQVLDLDAPKCGLDKCLPDAAKSNLRPAPKRRS